MDIEEEVWSQSQFWGEHPQIPQWEAVADKVILEDHLPPQTSEVSSVYPTLSEHYADLTKRGR